MVQGDLAISVVITVEWQHLSRELQGQRHERISKQYSVCLQVQ